MSTSTLIVGAGISGLATAHFLRKQWGPDADITVLEASPHLGGKINTVEFMGLPVDTGPDAFLARAVELPQLIDELGLTADVVEPQAGGSYIWSRSRLRPIPPGMAFGLPERLWPLLRTGLLSPPGVARAGLDIVRPATRLEQDDPSVADLVRPRFGNEVYARLVAPLIGGVHAGDPAKLSAKSTVPEIYAHRLRSSQRLPVDAQAAGFSAEAHGQAPRPAGIAARWDGPLGRRPGRQRRPGRHPRRRNVEASSGNRACWRVRTDSAVFEADDLVLAVPAHRAADLLRPLSPRYPSSSRKSPTSMSRTRRWLSGPGTSRTCRRAPAS